MRDAEKKAIPPLKKYLDDRIVLHFENWRTTKQSNISYSEFRRIFLLGLKEGVGQARSATSQIEQLITESMFGD